MTKRWNKDEEWDWNEDIQRQVGSLSPAELYQLIKDATKDGTLEVDEVQKKKDDLLLG